MKQLLNWKKRPLAYAFTLGIGIALLGDILHTSSTQFFFIALVVLYAILVFELLGTHHYATELLDQFKLPPIDPYEHRAHIIQYALLPTIFFFDLAGLVFYYRYKFTFFVIALVTFIIFAILFTNIYSYYESNFKIEKKTHYIYDVITILAALFNNILVINFVSSTFPGKILLITVLLLSSFILMSGVVLIRYKSIKSYFLKLTLLFGLLLTLTAILLLILAKTPLAVVLCTSLIFYYYLAVINHKLDNTLSKEILGEYLIVFLLFIALIIGLF